MLASEVAVLKARHGISLKCCQFQDTGPTDLFLLKMGQNGDWDDFLLFYILAL